MARPKKNTVDYFPHDCYWNKELEIFVNKYGNDGYAFYYRLFEQLGVSPNHKYECGEPVDKQYLASKTGVTEEKMNQYIGDLVSVGVIDESYWKEGIVWAQSFVDSVAVVYNKRISELPTKEGSLTENYTSAGFPERKQGFSIENGGFLRGNTQRREKKSKDSIQKESSDTHTTFDLNALATKYSTVDVETSYEKFTLNQLRNNKKSVNEAADFEMWLLNDKQNGWNVRPPIKKETVTLHCPQCGDTKEVMIKGAWKTICSKCDVQMVHKNDLPHV